MLEWGIHQTKYPVAIRVPGGDVVQSGEVPDKDYSNLNHYKITRQGNTVAVVALGAFYLLGKQIVENLKVETGIEATLINPRYITGIDYEMLNLLEDNHQLVITLEDGILDGGFGEKLARYYGSSDMKVLNYGLQKEFVDRYDVKELMQNNRLTVSQIVEDIKEAVL